MGPFSPSKKCEYILVAVDYVSKWAKLYHARKPTTSIPKGCLKK
jgi:hypothetical protein